MKQYKRPVSIDELNANHYMVSVHKYGFFLCREGTARILLGSDTYQISRNMLCVYAPDTFLQILERSADLRGILEEEDVSTYLPVLSSIDIRQRWQVRSSPCVEISEAQADELECLYNMAVEDASGGECEGNELLQKIHADSIRYLRYSICMKVMEAYFSNAPVEALPQSKDDAIFSQFLISVFENCHTQRTVQYYADCRHLSPYYFSTIVRKASGKSALQWIVEVSMTFCRQYLRSTDLSIKEIADRMNFPDQSTFCRYFKHHEGCSPSDYRGGRVLK